ncbi:MAG: hypothetical protein J7L14_02870 [Candidatus Diapherotrites archaeon]|nr:hypothetical protein [Candidatus Diapherotrites archaeon]
MHEALESIGLKPQEARIYLTLLKLGTAKAGTVAQKAKIKREAAYYTLNLLVEKGFASEVIKSGVKYYSALPPAEILDMIEEESRRKKEIIRSVIPKLKKLEKTAVSPPRVCLYEGEEGFKSVAYLLLEERNKVIYAYVPEKILHYLPGFHKMFRIKRRRRNILLRVITEKTKLMEEIKRKDLKELRKTKFCNIVRGLDTAFYILPKGIAVLKASEEEKLGLYIEDATLAKLHKRIFLELWKHLA